MKIAPKKNLGQNFLIDENVIDQIIDIANISREDSVLEVGPGTGALTKKIIEKKPKEITVIEKDKRLADSLKENFSEKINVINEDMLNFSYRDYFDKNLIIFGNLPYNISTQILAKWIKMRELNKFSKKFILMFQKEVADRIIAESNSKKYGRISILSNWRMKIYKIIDIEPSSFKPMPKVKSTLLVFVPKENFFKFKDPKNLEYVTNIFFSQRRKMIKKPLKFLFENFDEVSKKLSLNLSLRPQNLNNDTYYKICEIYEKIN
jgi:16S rRNA (adenine1518-N6/adenine1519-N6)-dimethyltransferase